jgi:hypothetical protein
MATFLSAYQARFSTQLRTNWSRPQNSSATTPDTTLEGLSDTDVVGEFKKRGITPDSTNDTHVTTAMSGVIARLMFYTQCPGWGEAWGSFKDDLELLAQTTSRDRIIPTTDSLLSPTPDTAGALPIFDRDNFQNYETNPPNGPSQQFD